MDGSLEGGEKLVILAEETGLSSKLKSAIKGAVIHLAQTACPTVAKRLR